MLVCTIVLLFDKHDENENKLNYKIEQNQLSSLYFQNSVIKCRKCLFDTPAYLYCFLNFAQSILRLQLESHQLKNKR